MGLMAGMAIAAATSAASRIEQAKLRGMSPQHRANHEAGLNGCHNHEPFKPELIVQDGWTDVVNDGFGTPVRGPKWKRIPFRMATDCQYSIDPMGLGPKDPKCAGCRWKQTA